MVNIETLIKNLEKNNMKAFYVKSADEIVPLVKTLIKKGDTISCGGSVTLSQCSVAELMQSGDYNFLDRSKAANREETMDIYRRTFSCDAFFCSANAVTQNGELYNVDGNSNRTAALVFGPQKVICIVGINKLVADVPAAVKRVKTVAAPLNAKRLNVNTPCAKTGICCAPDGDMGSGCACADRICANYVVSAKQRVKDRINVIICGEELGY